MMKCRVFRRRLSTSARPAVSSLVRSRHSGVQRAREGNVRVRGYLRRGPFLGCAPDALERLAAGDKDLPGLGVRPGRGVRARRRGSPRSSREVRAVEEGTDGSPGSEGVTHVHAIPPPGGRGAAGRRRDDRSGDVGRRPSCCLMKHSPAARTIASLYLAGKSGGTLSGWRWSSADASLRSARPRCALPRRPCRILAAAGSPPPGNRCRWPASRAADRRGRRHRGHLLWSGGGPTSTVRSLLRAWIRVGLGKLTSTCIARSFPGHK